MLTLLSMLPATIEVTAVAADWTELDEQELAAEEAKVESGLLGLYESVRALMRINKRRLYRKTHRKFDDYVVQRWGMDSSRYYQLEFWVETKGLLEEVSTSDSENPYARKDFDLSLLPSNEYQTRPLMGVEEADRFRAWQRAIDLNNGRRPANSHVKQAVAEIKGKVTPISGKREPKPDLVAQWQASHALERDRALLLESLIARLLDQYCRSGKISESLIAECSSAIDVEFALAG